MVALNEGNRVTLDNLTVPLSMFATFVVAHLAIRKLAPGADPAILPDSLHRTRGDQQPRLDTRLRTDLGRYGFTVGVSDIHSRFGCQNIIQENCCPGMEADCTDDQ